jgi:hypothetical protein
MRENTCRNTGQDEKKKERQGAEQHEKELAAARQIRMKLKEGERKGQSENERGSGRQSEKAEQQECVPLAGKMDRRGV